MSQDNSEGLDDLQFNLGKIQVISKSISMALSSLPKDNSCCSQVLTNIVGAIAESARSHENRLGGSLSRKWKWTIPQFSLSQHGPCWMSRKREKTLAFAGSWSASRRGWGRWSGWSRAQVQVHLVKPHLAKPNLSSTTLSTPTLPSPPCQAPPHLFRTLLELQDCWSTWPLPSGRWPRIPAAWNRSAEGSAPIQGEVLQNKYFSLWQ